MEFQEGNGYWIFLDDILEGNKSAKNIFVATENIFVPTENMLHLSNNPISDLEVSDALRFNSISDFLENMSSMHRVRNETSKIK